MSIFADLEDLVSDIVDEQFGDVITVHPAGTAGGGDSRRPADPDKAPFTLSGVIDFIPETTQGKGKEGTDGFQPSLTGSVCHLSVKTSELAAKGEIKKGWEISAALKDGPIRAKISALHPDKLGRITFVCTKL